GELRGWTLEQRYRTHAPAYFGRFLRRVEVVEIGALAEDLRDRLGAVELEDLLLADLILVGRLPERARAEQEEVWVVIEVSATVDPEDVERAARRAGHLRQAGYPAMAVAAGRRVSAEAQEAGVQAAVALMIDGRVERWEPALEQAFYRP
ncbi:MAG: hypothetical protein D6736_18380, partial [Nitrospinota bacterium]